MNKNYYHRRRTWYLCELLRLAALGFAISILFFNSHTAIFFLLPFLALIYKKDLEAERERKKEELRAEFKDSMILLAGTLNAGYSLENALIQTRRERMRRGDCSGQMDKELDIIINGLSCNKTLDALLMDFGLRSGIKEIQDFAGLILAAKEYGGNLVQIIRQCAKNLADKYSVRMEIETVVFAKKLEGNIMLAMPFVIIFYMRVTNPGYLDVLYETTAGKVWMGICLLFIMAAKFLTDRIVTIEV